MTIHGNSQKHRQEVRSTNRGRQIQPWNRVDWQQEPVTLRWGRESMTSRILNNWHLFGPLRLCPSESQPRCWENPCQSRRVRNLIDERLLTGGKDYRHRAHRAELSRSKQSIYAEQRAGSDRWHQILHDGCSGLVYSGPPLVSYQDRPRGFEEFDSSWVSHDAVFGSERMWLPLNPNLSVDSSGYYGS